MLNEKALLEFVKPYYADKDIMHNMWHIELVRKMVDKILSISKNYIQWIRKKVGHGKIILVHAGGCIFNEQGEALHLFLQLYKR